MSRHFDLVVVGTGAAAATAAHACRAEGWEVAMIDSRPYGGTCALRGCDPKKVLVGAAEGIDLMRRFEGRGVRSDEARIDWAELMRFKRGFTDPVPEQREHSLAEAGISTLHGRARFTGPRTLRVEEEEVTSRHVLIAAGSTPARLGIEGEEHLATSTDFLELETLPSRIVMVGGGYIAFEFAHVAARAGAEVCVLHRGPRPLEGFDPYLVDRLVEATREAGIDLRLEHEVQAVGRRGESYEVRADANGKTVSLPADLVVHAAGRIPEIDDLDLEAAGVEREKRGVRVDRYLRSVSNPAVFAAGDAAATDGLPLTPIASHEGAVAAANLLKADSRTADYRGTPTVVFTLPPLAAVGLTESQAREGGFRFRTRCDDTSTWYSSRRMGIRHSGYKVLVQEETERI
ncbi:MAG: NAD(P)/FAD-dependent oxidoreductase, partial [Gemmatimonadetes bacterium]|nr:NAD(P)/FAD-dependent oxidoreductase [Gemmatimonadota bacterium]